MIAGLLIGKDKSTGVPGKNVREVLGRPLAEYGFIAGRAVPVDALFCSTDSNTIASIGEAHGATHIVRPPELATPDALTEDVLVHAFEAMEAHAGQKIDFVALLFANNPCIDPELVRKGLDVLKSDDEFDSAFSVSLYNMFSPARARRLDDDGSIQPFIDLDVLGPQVSSIRDSQGDCYFCDLTVQVLRRRCFTHMNEGQQPFQWMGRRSYALKNDYGFDVDAEWQFPVIEKWLRDRGFTDDQIPYAL